MTSIEEKDTSNNNRGFHVGEQKVCIDVDLLDQRVEGYTDITVVPLDFELPHIILDSRQCEVSKVLVNDKQASFTYGNSLDSSLFPEADIRQHHLLYAKLSGLYQKENRGELIINVPSSVKIRIDTNGDSVDTAFVPVKVRIYYFIQSPVMGMTFVSSQQQYPHAFTQSEPIGASTCCWVPCVDNIWERCIWEFEISTHQSMRDLLKSHSSSPKDVVGLDSPPLTNEDENEDMIVDNPTNSRDMSTGRPTPPNDVGRVENNNNNNNNDDEEEEQEQDNPDILVVCSGDLVRQVPHPTDAGKKTVIFSLVSPVAAPHVGFTIGPFVKTSLSDLAENDNEQDENFSASSVEVFAYSLAGKVPDVINTCLFMFKVVDFFTREYGSYPFSNFSLCFVDNVAKTNPAVSSLYICPESLLYPPDIIDPVYDVTKTITMAVASQWVGINIIPRSYNDLWLVSGIAGFITYRFIQTLMGNNEYRYRLKQDSEKICRLDINKPPIAKPAIEYPIVVKDLAFLNLKSPVILNILDRRMSKTGGAFGLSRVIPKIFLQAMSGDLVNGALSTSHFMHVCERVSHLRLEPFFNQWVYGSGYPIFRVTQRFNKKKMFVEMGIRQVQLAEIPTPKLDKNTFLDDSRLYLQQQQQQGGGKKNNNSFSAIQPVFTGPMTIRIHEADGTPYEHVIDLKENFTKLDIPYNTKYKRLKRNKKQKERAAAASNAAVAAAAAAAGEDGSGGGDGEDNEGVLLHSLGDVLQTDAQIAEWKLQDWSQEDENRMTNEAFEWIRLDADFEWICKLHLNQPDYMFASQLQQDRDVIAQFESVQYFSEAKPSNVYASLLTRTLMDKRYYYGIRLQAALALSRYATEDVQFLGQFHLVKAFQSLYCFENSLIPLANDFSDISSYFLQKTIPLALSHVKDKFGRTPAPTRNFLIDLLRYNDNSNNEYSDCYYIASLIRAITTAAIRSDNAKSSSRVTNGINSDQTISFGDTEKINNNDDDDEDDEDGQDRQDQEFVQRFVNEIDRCENVDKYIPSYHNVITVSTIQAKERLGLAEGFIKPNLYELTEYSWHGNNGFVRRQALQSLMVLGGIKDVGLLKYIFTVLKYDPSPVIRSDACDAVVGGIGMAALDIKESQKINSNNNNSKENPTGLMVVEENAKVSTVQRRETITRASLAGAIEHIKKELSGDVMLQREIWDALTCDEVGIIEKRELFNLANLLYDTVDSLIVHVPMPTTKRLVAKLQGKSMLVIKRESKFKIHLSTAGLLSKARRNSGAGARSRSNSNAAAAGDAKKRAATIKLTTTSLNQDDVSHHHGKRNNNKRRQDEETGETANRESLQTLKLQKTGDDDQDSNNNTTDITATIPEPPKIKIKLKLKPPPPPPDT